MSTHSHKLAPCTCIYMHMHAYGTSTHGFIYQLHVRCFLDMTSTTHIHMYSFRQLRLGVLWRLTSAWQHHHASTHCHVGCRQRSSSSSCRRCTVVVLVLLLSKPFKLVTGQSGQADAPPFSTCLAPLRTHTWAEWAVAVRSPAAAEDRPRGRTGKFLLDFIGIGGSLWYLQCLGCQIEQFLD